MRTLTLLLLLSSSIVFAQNSSEKWYLGLQGGVGKSFRSLKPMEDGGANNLWERNKYEISQPAWNVGMVVGRRLFHRLWLEGGYSFSYYSVLYSREYGPNELYHYRHQYYNTDISGALKFYTNEGRFKGFLFAGSEANIIITWRETIAYYIDGETTGPHRHYPGVGGYNWLAFSIQGGAGVSYQIGKRLQLEARYLGKSNLTPSRAQQSVEDYLNYHAMNVGLLMRL